MSKWVLAFLVAVLTSCGSNTERQYHIPSKPEITEVAFSTATLQKLEHHFDSLSGNGRFNAVWLFAHGDSIFQGATGYRKLRTKDSLRPDDKFQLASVSKPITALGVLLLADRGLVDLDAPVQQYLLDFPDERITISQMLSHSSGMGNYMYVTDSIWNNPDSFMTNDEMYCMLAEGHVPAYYEPGQQFDYCNTNFAVLPVLIEAVSGQPFKEFMQSQIFVPLGMEQCEFLNPEEHPSDEFDVIGHYPSGKPKLPFYLDGIVGDKSLYCSANDLFQLFKELKEPTLWSDSIIREAFQPNVYSGKGMYYGLGWRINPTSDGDTIVYHNGWWRGFKTYFWLNRKQEKVAIILSNSTSGGFLNQEKVWSLY